MKKKTPEKSKKKNSLPESDKVQSNEKCDRIVIELNKEYASKCKSKVNSLDKCNTCEIENENWAKINSRFDAALLNTGYDGVGGAIASGAGTDLQWEVGIGDNTGPNSVSTWIPAIVYRLNAWVSSPFTNANWISYFNDGRHSNEIILYFRIRFYLNSSINASNFSLDMSFYADNSVNDIFINGFSQAANFPTLLPQEQGDPNGSYNHQGYISANGVNISLDRDWQACYNEIVVCVYSGPGYVGFLAQNTSDCYKAESAEYHPSIEIKWGDSECDCIESDDFESMCLTVCNNYSNINFKNFKIGKLEICDEKGNPVATLPNGDPSVQLIPKGPFCFGDIPTCSCVSREFAILIRGAKSGKYKVKVTGICYDVCLNYHAEECFEFEICKD